MTIERKVERERAEKKRQRNESMKDEKLQLDLREEAKSTGESPHLTSDS